MSLRMRALSLLLAFVMILGMLPISAIAAETETDMPFTDVAVTDWFYDGVKYVYDNGLMVGTSNTTFEPSTITTRAMVVAILYRLDGSPTVTTGGTFTDVGEGLWYTSPVEWASANGIVSGYGNGLFGPNDVITREQMATIIYQYSVYKGYDVSKQNDLSSFTDADTVSDWARAPIAWANAEGLILGTSNTTLSPTGDATRAQVAAVLKRFCENVAANASQGEGESEGEDEGKDEQTSTGVPQSWFEGNDLLTNTGTPQNTFTVTFYMNDGTGSVYKTTTVVAYEMVKAPTSPSREGYIFDGWYEDEDCTEAYDFELIVMENINLYAGWKQPGPYNVIFDSTGGSAVPPQTVSENQLVIEPEDPEKDGAVFIGWLTEEDQYFEFDEIIDRDLTLRADWATKGEAQITPGENLNTGSSGEIKESLNGGKGITDVEVSGEFNGDGKIVADEIKTGPLLSIPGYLTAVDINAIGGEIGNATIAFRYDPAQLAADGIDPMDLAIVWYDEQNDIVVLLDSHVDTNNNIVYVETSHLSKYAVVDVSEWMAAQTTQLPTIRTDESPYYNVILAMDCSGSMDGEKMSKSIEAAQNMIDVLADEDRVTLLAFDDSTREVFSQVQLVTTDESGENIDNREIVKSQIASLNAGGGTNIETALSHSLQNKSDDGQYQSFVILLSDGQSNVRGDVLDSLKANNMRVIAVGIGGDVDSTMMQTIADSTDGSYLYCDNAGDLAAAFVKLQADYFGATEDSDGDGLPNLLETTGMRDQYGEIWTTNPDNPDSDGDGISDGEEMGLYHPIAQYPYFQRVSRPDLYTVRSKDAYLLMPEKMMYSMDMDNNRVKLEVYVTDGGYRMVPDLLTPPDPDGIAKEYVYSRPQNLKVELSGLPDGVVIDSLNTVEEDLIPGSMATSYKTTAILSYTKSVVIDNVTWTVTADNCSEWSGYAENGIEAKYVQKTQSVPDTKIGSKQNSSNTSAAWDVKLATAAQEICQRLHNEISNKENELENNANNALEKLKESIVVSDQTIYGPSSKNKGIPSQLYEAFARAILEALDVSSTEDFETDPKRLTVQICTKIMGGMKSGEETVKVGNTNYTVSYNITALFNLASANQRITWREDGTEHEVLMIFNTFDKTQIYTALADYCTALARLNTKVWSEVLKCYTEDLVDLMGLNVTTARVDQIFEETEKVIKALTDKSAANELIKDMETRIKDKLTSNLTNAFKAFIKDYVPSGDKIVKAAELFESAKERYDDFKEFANSSESEQKASLFVGAYNSLQKHLKDELGIDIGSISL